MAPSLTTNVDEYPGAIFAATELSKDTPNLVPFPRTKRAYGQYSNPTATMSPMTK